MKDVSDRRGKLGLACAQFGLDRPAADPKRRSAEAEAGEILQLAARSGVSVLDTFRAEQVVGALTPRPSPFHLVVKTARADRGPDFVEAEARASLARLGAESAYAIMVDQAGELCGPYGPAMWYAAEGPARRGPVLPHRPVRLCLGRPGGPGAAVSSGHRSGARKPSGPAADRQRRPGRTGRDGRGSAAALDLPAGPVVPAARPAARRPERRLARPVASPPDDRRGSQRPACRRRWALLWPGPRRRR